MTWESLHGPLLFPLYHVARIAISLPGDTGIQDRSIHPGAPPRWSVFPGTAVRLAGPPQCPDGTSCHPAVYAERGSLENGRSSTFLQNHRQCQGHQTRSSFPNRHKAWLSNIKDIKWETPIFLSTPPLSFSMDLKQK